MQNRHIKSAGSFLSIASLTDQSIAKLIHLCYNILIFVIRQSTLTSGSSQENSMTNLNGSDLSWTDDLNDVVYSGSFDEEWEEQ